MKRFPGDPGPRRQRSKRSPSAVLQWCWIAGGLLTAAGLAVAGFILLVEGPYDIAPFGLGLMLLSPFGALVYFTVAYGLRRADELLAHVAMLAQRDDRA